MKGKILCVALLSAALILLPTPAKQDTSDINNIERKTANVEQARKSATQEVATLQEKTPEPPAVLSETAVNVQTSVKASEPEPQPITEKERLMQAAGIPKEDWNATSYIVSKESSWCYKRMNGEHRPCGAITQPTREEIGSKAYGLCQALPVTKMASEGADYLTNPLTQLRWCHKYAQERYKGWSFAYAFWRANRWW